MSCVIAGVYRGIRSKAAAATAVLLAFSFPGAASAYVGESFLQVPGLAGGVSAGKYKDSVKFDAQYWEGDAAAPNSRRAEPGRPQARGLNAGGRVYYSGPLGPRTGAGVLNLALDKRSTALQPLMEWCQAKRTIPEMNYAESSELSRMAGEWGDRPASIPEFFEYKFKDVQLSCPENHEGAEQAFILNIADVALTNYAGTGEIPARAPAKLAPSNLPGDIKTFVLTFISTATNVGDEKDQCPKLSEKPSEDQYYALMTKEAADKERREHASSGGAASMRGGLSFRGPGKVSACWLPGTVRDPGHNAPVSDVARGLDLDGGQHKHKNFVSPDGRKGIDNQLITVDGCISGLRREGLLTSARNELMRQGTISVLVQVSGIESIQNDKDVDVTVLYSLDPMVRSVDGSQILPNYTFGVTEDPELAPDFARIRGRIENGVVTTDAVKRITFHEGSLRRTILQDARFRLDLQANGKMTGILAGYQDWRTMYNDLGQGNYEGSFKFTCPGMYNAFKRGADGLADPETGELRGISSTYEFEAVQAFISPKAQKLLAEAGSSGVKER